MLSVRCSVGCSTRSDEFDFISKPLDLMFLSFGRKVGIQRHCQDAMAGDGIGLSG
ncbi:hypothetical protein C4K00_3657 [Pseudomonas synxantha]|nr:hypothetical protein C4K00_3657 [Pseudomonas synxantha]